MLPGQQVGRSAIWSNVADALALGLSWILLPLLAVPQRVIQIARHQRELSAMRADLALTRRKIHLVSRGYARLMNDCQSEQEQLVHAFLHGTYTSEDDAQRAWRILQLAEQQSFEQARAILEAGLHTE